jgi:predicted transposase YbfD/YdcC
MDILIIAVCAVISGAEGWEDIEEYGEANAAWLGDLLDLPHGIPGHDTFRRVLSQLDPEELTQCFIAWTQALSEASGGEMVSIDGNTLRHSFDQATATAAIPMLRCGKVDIESLECLKPTRPCPMLSLSIKEVGDGAHQVVGTSW